MQLAELEILLAPSISALGLELWGISWAQQGKQSVLRVYVDGPNGVTIDDCSRVSRQISAVLLVENDYLASHGLEVSSPGLDRPLFKPEQYGRFLHAKLNVTCHIPQQDRRRFSGRLVAVNAQEIILQVDGQEIGLPFSNIAKANVVPEFNSEAANE
jgi:ribosome maturation factor RimP